MVLCFWRNSGSVLPGLTQPGHTKVCSDFNNIYQNGAQTEHVASPNLLQGSLFSQGFAGKNSSLLPQNWKLRLSRQFTGPQH